MFSKPRGRVVCAQPFAHSANGEHIDALGESSPTWKETHDVKFSDAVFSASHVHAFNRIFYACQILVNKLKTPEHAGDYWPEGWIALFEG
jgi:hypothetical protein